MTRRVRATDSTVIDASLDSIWTVLTDFRAYSQWWPSLVRQRVLDAPAAIVGTRVSVSPLGSRGFECQVEHIEAPKLMVLRYADGIYHGDGIWTLNPADEGTQVTYEIDLTIEDGLIRLLSYVIPVAGLHSWLMKGVFRGLAKQVARHP